MVVKSTSHSCQILADADLTGPGIRIAIMIPVIQVLLLSLLWTTFRQRLRPEVVQKLSKSLCYLNSLQLSTVIILLSIAWSRRATSDWFHLHFVLHNAGLSGWSTALAAIIIPGWFTTKMLQLPALIGCLVLLFLSMNLYETELYTALDTHPACFERHPRAARTAGMWIMFALLMILFLFVTLFNRKKRTDTSPLLCKIDIKSWNAFQLLLLQSLPILGIGQGMYAMLVAYPAQKHFLERSEDEWTAGQMVPVCFIAVSSLAEVWNTFEMDAHISSFLGTIFASTGLRISSFATRFHTHMQSLGQTFWEPIMVSLPSRFRPTNLLPLSQTSKA